METDNKQSDWSSYFNDGETPDSQKTTSWEDYFSEPEPPKSTNSDILSGLAAGTYHAANTIDNGGNSYLYGVLHKLTGDADYQAARDEYAKKYQEMAHGIEKKFPRNVESFSTAKSVGDFIDVAQRDVAEGIPMLLGLTPAALTAPEAGLGALVAAAIPDVAIQTIQSDQNLKAQGVDAVGSAFLMGAAKHGLNYLGKLQFLKKVFGTSAEGAVEDVVASKFVNQLTGGKLSEESAKRVGGILSEFTRGGASFAPVGMAQAAIDHAGTAFMAENKDFFTKENMASIMETGVAGFLTGGLLGGGHAYLKGGGTKTPEPLQQKEQGQAQEQLQQQQQAPITDVGTATKYLTDRNLDPTIFSTEETLIAAANRLKANAIKQEALSPALSVLHMESGTKLLEGPQAPEVLSATDAFFKARAEELRNNAILAQPEAQSLVAKGIAPHEVVKMTPEHIQTLSERISKSYDATSKPELDRLVADKAGNVMDQKTADARKAAFEDLQRKALDNKVENEVVLKDLLRSMQKQFMPGDGMIISPTENDSFIGKLQDAYNEQKAAEQYKNVTKTEPSKDSIKKPEPLKTGEGISSGTIWNTMKAKKNHPVPESSKIEPTTTAKYPAKGEYKQPSIPDETRLTLPKEAEMPAVAASKNHPDNDSRMIEQETKRTLRNLKEEGTTRKQTLQPMTPEEAQLHRSHNMPTMIFNGMRLTPMSHDFRARAAETVQHLERIVREVAGPHAKIMPVEALHSLDPYTAEPVSNLRGAQYRNLILTSLEHMNNPKAPLQENVLHEVWHMLRDDTTTFTKSDEKLLELERPRMLKDLQKNFELADKSLDLMDSTPSGRKEIEATHFGLVANQIRAGLPHDTSPALARVYKKVLNILSKFGNYLRGAGFRTYEDLFKAVNAGERQAKASDFIDDAVNEMRQARLQKISEEVQQAHINSINSAAKERVLEMEDAIRDAAKYKKSAVFGAPADWIMGLRNRYIRTAMGLAHQHEAWRIPVEMGINLQNAIRKYNTRYSSLHEAATTGYTKEQIKGVHDLLDKLSTSGQKAKFEYNPDGTPKFEKMTYLDTEQGKVVVSEGAAFNKQYWQSGEPYRQVMHDSANNIRNTLERHGIDRSIPLPELAHKIEIHQRDRDMLAAQDKALKAKMRIAKKKGDEKTLAVLQEEQKKVALQRKDKELFLEPLEDALTNLQDIDAALAVDYAPQMRFGPYGVSVYKKEDVEPHPDRPGRMRPIEGRKAAYFGTIERALPFQKRITDDASHAQYKDHIDEIKRLGLDSADHVIFGKDKPFFLTHDSIGHFINNRAVTLDLMFGLMQDKNMDAYVSMMQNLKDKTALKGFAKHFSERQNIPGYSKDWQRVAPKYLTGAAHFLGKREVGADFATYRMKVATMNNPDMQKDLLAYLDYMDSPNEEYLAAREVNYLWALGMNPMSAILQAMTLPTTTHMSMNTYSPNPIKNAMYIAKWSKKALALSNRQHWDKESGMWVNDFAKREVVDALISQKFFDKDPSKNKEFGNFMHLMANMGRLEGFYKNNMATEAVRGHKTTRDQAYHHFKNISNRAGFMLSFMETSTRMATVMAHYDMIRSEKGVMDRAHRVLKDDKVFQASLKDTRFTPEQHLALFGMDEAHAVFSKAARGTFQRGIAGVVMPFTQYPVQTLEVMGRQLGRGPEAKAALAMNLGMLMVLSGALGLPGANIIKDASEWAYKHATGHNVDLDEVVREKLMDMGATPAMSVMATQGFSRPVLGVDLGKRIGFGDAIPSIDLLMSLFGIRGNNAIDAMGVQGSIVKNAGLAWNDYNNGAGAMEIAAKLSPSSIANMMQAYNYGHAGVKSAKGDMLIPPSQVSTKTRFLKGIGVTPGVVTDAREAMHFTTMKETEWTDFISHNTKLLSSLRTERILATKHSDKERAQELLQKEQDVISSLRKWQRDTGYPLNFTNMTNNIRTQVQRNLTGRKPLKDVKKAARKSVKKIDAMTNISGDDK